MPQWKAPQIERRWVAITTKPHAALAAIVSSHFRAPGVYFAVFEFPSIPTPRSPVIDYSADGAFGQIVGTRAATWINNALAGIQPGTILLLGLTEAEKTYLAPLLPAPKVVEINSADDIGRCLPPTSPAVGSLRCRPQEAVLGLAHAKFLGKALVIDEGAEPLVTSVHRHGGPSIVIVESDGGIDDLVAVNYAFAIDADVTFVPAIDRRELDGLPRQLDAWSRDRSSRAFDPLRRQITIRIKQIDFRRYEVATFFTVGLPYGLVLKNTLPCSHVLKGPYCGPFVTNSIAQEYWPITFDSALLFSPELFASEETADIAKALDADHYSVRLLLGSEATLKNLDNYGSLFPYDVLHICSHGGETDGYKSTLEFVDRLGGKHRLDFYEIVGFSPSGGEMVRVETKAIFVALDGLKWRSEPLKTYPKYVFDDMFVALKEDRGRITRQRVHDPIALSCHIQCYDSIHQGVFQHLAAFGRPLVFNNTCSSNYEMAGMFAAAGARCYIGTLWAVDNSTAVRAATMFYGEALKHGNILAAFAVMNKSIRNKQCRDVYIYWGLQFSSMPKPAHKSLDKVFAALVDAGRIWVRRTAVAPNPEIKRNCVEALKFLRTEILGLFAPGRLEQLRDFDFSIPDEYERMLPPPSPDELARAASGMTLRSELRKRTEPFE
jgi:hypothetical protein